MNTIPSLLTQSLLYGAIYTLTLSLSFLLLARINPEIFLNDYPPDIKARFGPMSPKARQQRNILGIPVFVFMLGFPFLAIFQLAQNGPLTFGQIFLGLLIIYTSFNFFDLLVLDWLIFCTFPIKLFILPGTEGMPGYKDYAFHFWGSVKGQIGLTLVSLILAGLLTVFL